MARYTDNPYYQDQYGDDPRGYLMNESNYQKQRYEDQQGPMVNAIALNYGRATEANYGDYTDIMNQYRDIASGGMNPRVGGSGGEKISSGGGGSGGGYIDSFIPQYTAFTVSPGSAGYTDPFKSYSGFEDFSKTGGYSTDDISNMRARGMAPIRAAYANAERNIGQQRSLQGGYAPNAIATQAKMAREQGQGMADASTNLEAQLAQMKQGGRLSGLSGMSGIETSRLGADVDISKFNTGLDFQGQTYNADAMARAQAQNIGAAEAAAARRQAASIAAANRDAQARSAAAALKQQAAAQSSDDRFRALSGMTSLYGATPGMSNMFGSQLINSVGQGGAQGNAFYGNDINAVTRPGQYEQTMSRVKDIAGAAGTFAYPFMPDERKRQPQQQQPYQNYSYEPPQQPQQQNYWGGGQR